MKLPPYGPLTVIFLFTLAGGLFGMDVWLWPWGVRHAAIWPVMTRIILGFAAGATLADVIALARIVTACWLRGDAIVAGVFPLIVDWIETGSVPRVKEQSSDDLSGVKYY